MEKFLFLTSDLDRHYQDNVSTERCKDNRRARIIYLVGKNPDIFRYYLSIEIRKISNW